MRLNQEPSDDIPEPLRKLKEALDDCGSNEELDDFLSDREVLMAAIARDSGVGCMVDLQCKTIDNTKISASLMGIAVTTISALISGTKKDPDDVFAKIRRMVDKVLKSPDLDFFDIPDDAEEV